MTNRERFVRTLKFQPVDRVPDLEFGAWTQTIERWNKEGLPEKHGKDMWTPIPNYFKTDDIDFLDLGVKMCLYRA